MNPQAIAVAIAAYDLDPRSGASVADDLQRAISVAYPAIRADVIAEVVALLREWDSPHRDGTTTFSEAARWAADLIEANA